MLAGGFNCRLPAMHAHVGIALLRWHGRTVIGTTHHDEGHFATLVKVHDLCALNSWNSKLGPSFVHEHWVSRIGFLFTRLAMAGGIAKGVKYLWNAPFLGMRPMGHALMVTQFRPFWIPTKRNGSSALCRPD